MKQKGVFITFEGGEGAGKTTVIQSLETALKQEGRDVLSTREPGGSELGAKIRHLLLEQRTPPICCRAELLLFLADRAEHVSAVLLPALEQGKIILCDRFTDSTYAYQGVARGLPSPLLAPLCAFASQDLTPDLTFYLDIDPEIGLSRVVKARTAKDRIESETISFHQKLREAFSQIAKDHPQRVTTLDGTSSPQALFHLAKQKINRLIDDL